MTEDQTPKEEKKRYWLKLDKNFLKSTHIKVIKNMPNGRDYIIFYLALMLESVETIGHLRFSNLVPYNEEMLSSITDTNIDIVRSAIKIFESLGLMERLEDGTIYMTQVAQMTGKESESAERVRRYRLRQEEQKALQCNTNVTKSNDNKEEEEYKEITIILNNSVSVSEAQLKDFFVNFGIEIDNQYKIVKYLNGGMDLEVIANALQIPITRNGMQFTWDPDYEPPIKNNDAYAFTILENWFEFGVKNIDDVKKYNKLKKNMN